MGMDVRCSASRDNMLSIDHGLYCSTVRCESHGIELYYMVGRARVVDLEPTNYSIHT